MIKVLLVDDDENLLTAYEEELKEAGYEVFTAPNGRVALHVLEFQDPDLVVLDAIVPKVDGLGVTERIMGEGRKAKIIINADYAGHMDDCRLWVPDACMVKSLNVEALKDTIQQVLDRPPLPAPATH
jgi:DNA-binding response OmpR family regulator